MAAGLVSHSITTSVSATFGVMSWVPNTATPDVGAVPVAMITDGTNVAPVSATLGLKVDGSGVTQPVSGTVTVNGAVTVGTPAVTQSGTWTVQPGNTANTTAWLVNNVAPWDKGPGTAGSATQRMIIDSSQLGALVAGGVPVVSGGFEYETVAANVSTAQVLGATGAVGDYLESLLCVVGTAATSQVSIADGNGSDIIVLPNAVGAGVGTYPIPIGLTCVNSTTPGWKVKTGAGVTVLATGNFT